MSEPRDVVVTVSMELDDLDLARQEAADMAWDHAKAIASSLGFDLGSDEHVDLHKELAERYEHSVEHMMFFMQHAFAVLSAIFETGYIKINAEDGPLHEDIVCARIGHLAQGICRSYMQLMAGYETLWPTNEMLPQSVSTQFYFNDTEINMEDM
jgi:hypothetical protein